MSHRVKNSLTSVVGLLRVQAASAQSLAVKNALQDASSRVATIAQIHDHLWRGTQSYRQILVTAGAGQAAAVAG